MITSLSEFTPIPTNSIFWTAQKGALRCTALRLRNGSLCLYSPVRGLDDTAVSSLAALGTIAFLLAPNHYHNKGLTEYVEAFPDAALVCSERAKPRLEKQTGLSFGGLHLLEALLPDDCNILEPEGLKTGEVWLTQATGDRTVWVVCDAFKGASGKVGSVSEKIELIGTFPTYGIQDKGIYSEFVKAKLNELPPRIIVPCHGSLVRSESLATKVIALLD